MHLKFPVAIPALRAAAFLDLRKDLVALFVVFQAQQVLNALNVVSPKWHFQARVTRSRRWRAGKFKEQFS